MEAPQPQLSIIIPAYNEAAIIEATLSSLAAFLAQRGLRAEVIVVDDGSTDGTGALAAQALQRLKLPGRVLRQQPNAGKGKAVQAGMLAAAGQWLLMTDADLSTPLDEYDRLAAALLGGADIAIASRALPGARLEPPQPRWRQMLGQLYAWVRRLLLLPQLRDTQCGFKLFRQEAARAAFSRQTLSGWAFDVEVLYIAYRLGYRIAEIPVRWCNRRESKVRVLRDAPRVLRDLLLIRWRHRGLVPSRAGAGEAG
jgi:dolichyl-phosphate beta-glucosyltransferase